MTGELTKGALNRIIGGNSTNVTCNGATPVVVAWPDTTANSQISFTVVTPGGTVGATPSVKTKTPGTGFTFAGTAGDTSVYIATILN